MGTPFLKDFAVSAPLERRDSLGLEALISNYSNEDLALLVQDFGGHDLAKIIQAGRDADEHRYKPTAIICHTVKGWRMPEWAAHPENHGALMTAEQLAKYRTLLELPDGDPFGLPQEEPLKRILSERANELFSDSTTSPVRFPRKLLPARDEVRIPLVGERSSSAAFGTINTAYLRLPIGKFMAFIAPDVGLTTHLGGVISMSGVYEQNPGPDLLRFLREKRRTIFNWRQTPNGRFHSVAINEGVAAMKLYAFGRRKVAAENKLQMLPVATIYDVFWKHAYTQLYYALYDHARFLAVGTPSGTSLSRESGTHQSRQTPAIIMGLPNTIYYEPAYSFDVITIYEWALRQMTLADGEAVYIRLSTQELVQPWGQPADNLLQKHGLSRLPVFPEDEISVGRPAERCLERRLLAVGPKRRARL